MFQLLSTTNLSRLFVAALITISVGAETMQAATAQRVNLETLCQRFPLNSQCKGYRSQSQDESTSQSIESNQIIKIRLELSGEDNEWIRIATNNTETGEVVLSAYHTTRVRRRLLSTLATGVLSFGAGELAREAIDGFDGGVPVPDINFYRWVNHPTRRLIFVPDRCSNHTSATVGSEQLSLADCTVTGTDSITLPIGTDLYSGLLTIEYAENELIRTITFRVPKNT